MRADERALPFRHPEEREHFSMVEEMVGDAMRYSVGLIPHAERRFPTRHWWGFATSDGPSRTGTVAGLSRDFDVDVMRRAFAAAQLRPGELLVAPKAQASSLSSGMR